MEIIEHDNNIHFKHPVLMKSTSATSKSNRKRTLPINSDAFMKLNDYLRERELRMFANENNAF